MNDLSQDRIVLEKRERDALSRLLHFIEDATLRPHFLGSLFSHLCGTWKILNRQGCRDELALAGLLHSIYSTEHYARAIVPATQRARVAETVGSEAEKFVYFFCALHKTQVWEGLLENRPCFSVRSRFDNKSITLNRYDARCLLQIACADWIEQCAETDGSPRPFMAWFITLVQSGLLKLHPQLGEDAKIVDFTEIKERSSIDAYNVIRTDPALIDNVLCQEAATLNPFSAELQLLVAIHYYRRRKYQSAQEALRRAQHLLTAWGTPWDKRLTILEWEKILRLMTASELSTCSTAVMEKTEQIVDTVGSAKLPSFAAERNQEEM